MKRSGKSLFWNKNNIKTCSNTLINRKLTDYVVRIERSVGRGVENYYFGIKTTLKLAQTHQPVGNSPAMLLELKEINSKRSDKLSYWNKNIIKTCSNTSINRKLTPYVVRIKRGQYMKKSGKLLFWNKNNIKTCSNTSINRKLTDYVVRIKRGQ